MTAIRASTAGPPAVTQAAWRGGVAHDVRAAATAIDALADLASSEAPGLPGSSQGLLRLIQARAEELAVLCDALACLDDRPAGTLPFGRILHSSGLRLQKLLARCGVGLKLPGEIPDIECERPLGLLLQAILLVAVNARGTSQAGTVEVKVDIVNTGCRIALDLVGPGWGAPSAEAVASLAGPDPAAAGTIGLAAAHALSRLGATLGVIPAAPGEAAAARIMLVLPPPRTPETAS